MYLNLDVFEITLITQKRTKLHGRSNLLEKHAKVRKTTLTMGSKNGGRDERRNLTRVTCLGQ